MVVRLAKMEMHELKNNIVKSPVLHKKSAYHEVHDV